MTELLRVTKIFNEYFTKPMQALNEPDNIGIKATRAKLEMGLRILQGLDLDDDLRPDFGIALKVAETLIETLDAYIKGDTKRGIRLAKKAAVLSKKWELKAMKREVKKCGGS